MSTAQPPPVKKGDFWALLTMALIVALGAWNTYQITTLGSWLGALLFGATVPLIALGEWLLLRRRSDEARFVADRMLLAVFWALVCVGVVLERY